MKKGLDTLRLLLRGDVAAPGGRRTSWLKPLLATLVILLPLVAFAVILFLFNPEHSRFYPRCPLYQMTGLLCPGCGSLRALHQLTHGHVITAFYFNPLLVLLLPALAWMGLRTLVWQIAGKKWPALLERDEWCWLLLVAIVVFGILRNFPQR